MGCGSSKVDSGDKSASGQNDKIERQLRADRKQDQKTVKILLLGAGESGKSTIIKQMRILYSNGFQEDEKQQTKTVIYSNLLVACRVLLEIMEEQDIAFSDSSTAEAGDIIRNSPSDLEASEVFQDQEVNQALRQLWKDSGVQTAVQKGHEYALHDNMHYYFDNLDRMTSTEWNPTDRDMLHARLRTTGIIETFFDLKDITFRMMDVGGQRSERKKWIHCFDGVQCLMFLASLSGYDQSLLEDVNANQMHEALMLFESLINGEWFKDKPIILFLNKLDLFQAKLGKSPIQKHFPDFHGPEGDEKIAKEFFANKFKAFNKNHNREIYVYYTNATDTNLLKATMTFVQDILIQKQLNRLIL